MKILASLVKDGRTVHYVYHSIYGDSIRHVPFAGARPDWLFSWGSHEWVKEDLDRATKLQFVYHLSGVAYALERDWEEERNSELIAIEEDSASIGELEENNRIMNKLEA